MLKKSKQVILALVLSLVMLFYPKLAIASNNTPRALTLSRDINFPVCVIVDDVEGDTTNFELSTLLVYVPNFLTGTINSAVVSFEPDNTTGMIEELNIGVLPDDNFVTENYYTCSGEYIQEGSDLIEQCGDAVLQPGLGTYQAKGYINGTEPARFCVTLSFDN